MPVERYYYSGLLEEGNEIFLEDDEHHHLARVTRGRSGDQIEIINGKGQLGTAIVDSIEKRKTILTLLKVFSESPAPFSLLLYQGIPRLNRLETILEKCTELGATDILLFPSERSEKKLFSDHQMQRLNAILIAAIKQSGRLFLPKLTIIAQIKQWDNLENINGFYGDLRDEALWLADALKLKTKNSTISNNFAFCIGPESGLTEEETRLLEHKGFVGVKLHLNTLRTDTAAITAISIASHLLSAST